MERLAVQIQSRREYWLPKIRRNKERDQEVNEQLTASGWLVLRFWESRIRKDLTSVIQEILRFLPEKRETL